MLPAEPNESPYGPGRIFFLGQQQKKFPVCDGKVDFVKNQLPVMGIHQPITNESRSITGFGQMVDRGQLGNLGLDPGPCSWLP